MGEKPVALKPLVQLIPDREALVELTIGIYPEIHKKRACQKHGAQTKPQPQLAGSAAEEEEKHQRPCHDKRQRQADLPGKRHIVDAHLEPLFDDGQILGIDRVAATHELPVFGPGIKQRERTRQRKADPGATGQKPQQQNQNHKRQQIQQNQKRLLQVKPQKIQLVFASAKIEIHHPHAAAGQKQHQSCDQGKDALCPDGLPCQVEPLEKAGLGCGLFHISHLIIRRFLRMRTGVL